MCIVSCLMSYFKINYLIYIYGDATIAVKNCNFKSALTALCLASCDTGPRFLRSHPKDGPI